LIQNGFTRASQNVFSRGGDVASAIDRDAGDLAGRAIAEEFHSESEHQTFLDSMRLELGNPTRLVEANGQLYDTHQVSSKANHHRIETNRLRDSTTGGLEMLQAASSSASRPPLHLDRMLTYGQGPNGVGSCSAPSLSYDLPTSTHQGRPAPVSRFIK
jgi:hypothetical protein